ncbi:MAG: 2-C-methyl-D-erythritol 4-phosphate cytidylyltransferase [Candidatus Aminicenantes bacterium]|nr:MAG: 2-C-methyl-D-erythritol 4-phosphate cytidylyltransferase [Candidatus Aminicenantes bacterium]
MMKKNLALILAGGSGSRINNEIPKQFLKIREKTILQHSIEKFENHPRIHGIFLVIHRDFLNKAKEIVHNSGYKKVVKVLAGGQTRQESSRIGVTAVNPAEYENVLIHDAARPFVSKKIIDDILDALNTYSAVNVAVPSPDTIIEINDQNLIKHVPDRKYLRRVQTPQAFKLHLIQKAHELALEKGFTNTTDDCSLILTFKLADIYVAAGSPLNIKITYPLDLQIAEKMTADDH